MTKSDVYEIHSKFSKIHIPLLLVFLSTLFIQYLTGKYPYTMEGMILLLPALIFNIIGYHRLFFHSLKFLYLVRYIEIITASFAFTFLSDGNWLAVSLFLYCVTFIEFITLYDFSDNYYRIICSTLAMGPAFLAIIIATIVEGNFTFNLFLRVLVYLGSTAILVYCSIINENEKRYYEQRLYKQNRLLVDLNESNDALVLHQDKLKKMNEELGYKKVMLETAYKRINDSNIEFEIQNKVLKYIGSSLDMDKLIELASKSLYEELDLEFCALVINQQVINNKQVIYRIRSVYGKEFEEGLSEQINNGGLCQLLDCNDVFVDNRVSTEKYEFFLKSNIGSFLIAPLLHNNIDMGYLMVGHRKYDGFLDNVAFYESIVAQLIIAVNNANMFARMEYMATHDALTGVFNRGNLTKYLDKYIVSALKENTAISLALFDIDDFKYVNDTYSHAAGDVVIHELGTVARDLAMRHGGFVGRYGGEEFVIAFPGMVIDKAYQLVEDFRINIKKRDIIYNNIVININVSVGVTGYPETCKDPTELLNRADFAMYYSKQNGKDMVTIDSDEVREKVLMI